MISSSLSKEYQVRFPDTLYWRVALDSYNGKTWHLYPGATKDLLESISVLCKTIYANQIKMKRGWVKADVRLLTKVLGEPEIVLPLHSDSNFRQLRIWVICSSRDYIYSICPDEDITHSYWSSKTSCSISSLKMKMSDCGLYESYESSSDFCDFMRWLEQELGWMLETERTESILNGGF